MRTFLFVTLALISNVVFAQRYGASIKDRPKPARVVNDYGSFLTRSEKSNLENKLISYRKRSGNAIVIITLSTLPYSLEETALQYFNKWGIGDRKKNNGVLILLSREPANIRITTGIGIEHTLTDNDCQRIIDETIVPAFKAGRFYAGLNEGIDDIATTLKGGTQQNATQNNYNTDAAGIAQTQQQPATQPQTNYTTSTYTRKPPTLREIIGGAVMFTLLTWLRVLYVRARRRPDGESYSSDGSEQTTGNNNVTDWLGAAGWVFLLTLKVAFWAVAILFGFLALCFGAASVSRSLFRSAGGSFSGGRSSGGGASGSWGGGGGAGASSGGAGGSW
jgi:uncharacterized protein